MGTNYYALEPVCPEPCVHCQQDEWHIGKSLTMFEAHDTSPWGRSDFIERVEETAPDDRRRQYQWLVDHGYALDRDYLDADGFSFHRGEFF